MQVDLDKSDPIAMEDYGVYRCRWYIRNVEDSTKKTIAECRFWPEIREMKEDGTMGKIVVLRPTKVEAQLQWQDRVWYQDDISLAEHRLVGPFNFASQRPRRNGSEMPLLHTVEETYWRELEREGKRKGVDVSDVRKVVPVER